MINSILLRDGYKIPEIALGVYKMQDEAMAIEAIGTALTIGYRHIDTAAFYHNEAAVGKAIRQSGIAREDIFVTTKVWPDRIREGTQREAFEESYAALELDYIDLLLVHWPVAEKVEETWAVFQDIRKTGKVRSIGLSNHRIEDIQTIEKMGGEQPVVNQIEIHPYFQQNELVEYCQQHQICVEAWAPLCSGKNDLLQEPLLMQLAKTYKKSPAQIVLRWHIQRGIVPLPKSEKAQRQKENIDVFDFELTQTDMQAIAAMDRRDGRLGYDPAIFGGFSNA